MRSYTRALRSRADAHSRLETRDLDWDWWLVDRGVFRMFGGTGAFATLSIRQSVSVRL